jgi:hypothetical protein
MTANPAGLVYGTLLVAALLGAEVSRAETYPKTIGALAIALLLYWLAHSYAEFTGERIEHSEPFSYADLARTARRELTMLVGPVVPLLLILVCWAAGVTLASAVLAAVWTSAAMIVAAEIVIGVRAELTGRDLVRQTVVGAALGLLVIVLRVLLH